MASSSSGAQNQADLTKRVEKISLSSDTPTERKPPDQFLMRGPEAIERLLRAMESFSRAQSQSGDRSGSDSLNISRGIEWLKSRRGTACQALDQGQTSATDQARIAIIKALKTWGPLLGDYRETLSYMYRPLTATDSIRVLLLHPGESFAPIKIDLQEVQLLDDPMYEAVSYTWASEDGDATRSSLVLCEGAGLWVTKNCEAALRRFRKTDRERVLWVDAICINQEAIGERGHQVGIMKYVYTKAAQVLVWMGPASSYVDAETGQPVTDIFLDYLAQMDKESDRARLRMQYRHFLDQMNPMKSTSKVPSPLLLGLISISEMRWWERLWVVQEVALTKGPITVYCGGKKVSYRTLVELQALTRDDTSGDGHILSTILSSLGAHFALSMGEKDEAAQSGENLHLSTLTVLANSRGLKASDPRDHLYAILGLRGNLAALLQAPDYTKTAVEIFTALTVSVIETSNTLDVLLLAASADKESMAEDVAISQLALPSWVPDYSVLGSVFFPINVLEVYQAARQTKLIYEISGARKVLRVKGKVVDHISQFSPPVDRFTLKRVCHLWSSTLKDQQVDNDRWDAFSRTLCWDLDQSKRYQPSVERQARFKEWYDKQMRSRTGEALEEISEYIQEKEKFSFKEEPLLVTKKGYLASVPFATREGDHVAILSGGRMPYILRPHGSYRKLLGHCYVHGIMDGEAFPKDPLELEWIEIH